MSSCWTLIGCILVSLPGTMADNYNLGGLVASSACSFILFCVIICMVVVGFLWDDWYRKYQRRLGNVKVPRVKRSKHMSSLNGDIPMGSVRGSQTGAHLIPVVPPPSSRNSTLIRAKNADQWIRELPTADNFEEKGKSMEFEDEDEPMVITEVLPEGATSFHESTVLTQSHRPNDLGTTQNVDLRQTQQNGGAAVVRLTAGTSQRQGSDIIITPLIPYPQQSHDNPTFTADEAVAIFGEEDIGQTGENRRDSLTAL